MPIAEPKVRRDKKCVVCKGERPFNPQRGVSEEAYLGDPFCSSKCAREYFGTQLARLTDGGRPSGYYADLRKNR